MKVSEPVLTTQGNTDIDKTLIVNGEIDIRKTHPTLYLVVSTFGVVSVLLAANFYLLQPAFEVYHLSNWIWGAAFLALGVSKLWFLNIHRSLRAVRMTMACDISFTLFFAIGTCEPWLDGQGSLQLPIWILGAAAVQLWMLLEPFIQPWTAKRD